MEKESEGISKHSPRPLLERVVLFCVPLGILLIAVIGIIGYFITHHFMKTAIERNVRMRSTVIARSIEVFLENRIRDISYLGQGRINRQSLLEFMERQAVLDPELYREAAFIADSPSESMLFVMAQGVVQQIDAENFSDVRPDPMLLPPDLHALDIREVFCSTISSVNYPFPSADGVGNREEFRIIRLVTPYFESGKPIGHLILGFDARGLRNVLSQVSSSEGKIWGFERSDEQRFSYLFDIDGWILFQSEPPSNKDKKLSTYLARAGLLGTLGKPGIDKAFLPDKRHETYWETVSEIRKQEGGLQQMDDKGFYKERETASHFTAYEPIQYRGKKGGQPRLFGGMVYVDRSKLAYDARNSYLITIMVWGGGGLLLIALFILVVKRLVIHPLYVMKNSIRTRLTLSDYEPMPHLEECVELNELATATSEIFQTLELCKNKLEILSENSMSEEMQQPLDLSANYYASLSMDENFPDIIGISAAQVELKAQILKAASTNVDIFIVGETGTGKQLVAEAIHRHSTRRNGPFVAINCGALNENLLLDSLFGHVKGAHSEAKTERHGAFVESAGGTLFLDEIQSASLNVQQALLRAIAERKIRPLGSDTEIEVDLRLVTATNMDLTQLIKDGQFREDLFYRLYVLTIHTLPLRNHKEDIPLLAYHYLKQTQEFVGKCNLQFSQGTIKKLMTHEWPGNVRELVNCITRTVVFAVGPVIQADDLRMENTGMYADEPVSMIPPQGITAAESRASEAENLNAIQQNSQGKTSGTVTSTTPGANGSNRPTTVLSPRQIKVLPVILERKVITRKEYQHIVGDKLPARTANYDLNDMMQKGILTREGAGSTTRYKLDPNADIQTLRRLLG